MSIKRPSMRKWQEGKPSKMREREFRENKDKGKRKKDIENGDKN
jgi:hypothetical protein